MKDLDNNIGIDGPDGSGKDYLISSLFNDSVILRAGGVGKFDNKIKEFSLRVLLKQYDEARKLLITNEKIVFNRTFISFLVGEVIDRDLDIDKIYDRYDFLLNIGCFINNKHIIIERPIDSIKESLMSRQIKSNYEFNLITSDTLLSEQIDVFRKIGKKVGANIVKNNKSSNLFLQEVISILNDN